MTEKDKNLGGFGANAPSTGGEHPKNQIKNTMEEVKKSLQSMGGGNKKMLAGIFAIIFGAFGIHKFILGYYLEGVILLALTIILGVLSCGVLASLTAFVGLIEGIIYLTKSDEEFYRIYQLGKRPWF